MSQVTVSPGKVARPEGKGNFFICMYIDVFIFS